MKKEVILTDLSKSDLVLITGGWNLLEYVASGVGYVVGVLATPNASGGTWNSFYGGVQYDDPCC